jgi:hypothetical protein
MTEETISIYVRRERLGKTISEKKISINNLKKIMNMSPSDFIRSEKNTMSIHGFLDRAEK